MPRDGRAITKPDFLVTLNVIQQPCQGTDAARPPNDTVMQADGHHPRPSLTARAIEPVEGIATILEEILAGAEVAAALQAAVVVVEAVRNDQMALVPQPCVQ